MVPPKSGLSVDTVELSDTLRDDFPILATTIEGRPLNYLDNAATTQKPRAVIDAISTYYMTANSNHGRSVHALSSRATEAYEAAREKVRRFVNAEHAHEVIFTKNTTEAINVVAAAFEARVSPGDDIVITGMEHHTNLLPWRRLCERTQATLRVVPTDDLGRITVSDLRDLLTDRTRLVAVAHVSNVLGTVNPVKEIIAEAHRRDIPVLVDGAQAVARRTVDVQDLDADFYCFSAHKMYGPMGVGILYGKTRYLDELSVLLTGGGIAKGVSFDSEPILYMPLPNRLEAGTPNIADAVGLGAAVDYLTAIGLDRVGAHDEALTVRAASALSTVPGLTIMGDPDDLRGGIVSFVIDGLHPYDVGNHLSAHGVMVRTGVHCAIPFVDRLGVVGTTRVSFGVYNSPQEIDAAVDALATVQPGMWTKEHPTRRFF